MRHVGLSNCLPHRFNVEFVPMQSQRRLPVIDIEHRVFDPRHVPILRQSRVAGPDARQANTAGIDPELLIDSPDCLNVGMAATGEVSSPLLPYSDRLHRVRYVI
jgi:hypothetical protein